MKIRIFPLALCVLALASCSPTEYKVEREILIDAPADLVFNLVNNHKERDAWSPWEEKDPNMKKSYEGPEMGKGAIYRWSGNDSVGTGWMEILESEPNIKIKSKLVFTEPWQSESNLNWRFVNEGNQIKAIWTVSGELPGYLFWMDQSDMDEQMAPDFERGLANLKRVAEGRSNSATKKTKLKSELVKIKSQPYFYIKSKTAPSTMDSAFFSERYGKLSAYLKNGINSEIIGSPFAIFSRWDEANDIAVVEVALACESDQPANEDIKKGMSYSGDAIKCRVVGSYEKSGEAHEYLVKYVSDYGYRIIGNPWEVYITGPNSEPDADKWVTEIYYPVVRV